MSDEPVIDPQKLNTIFNLLKDLVGPQGAFVLVATKAHGECGEETQIRTRGPHTRVMGIINLYMSAIQERLVERVMDTASDQPMEPD